MVETFIYFIHQTSRIFLFRLSFERNERLIDNNGNNKKGGKREIHMGKIWHHFTKTLQSFECVATCPIFCHTTITLHKLYLIILNIVGSVLMIVNNAVPTVPVDTGEL